MVLWSGSRREGEAVACGKGLGLFNGLASTLHFPRLQRPKLNDPGDPLQPHKLNPWSDSVFPSTKPRSTSPSPDWPPHRPPGCLFPLRGAWLFDTAAGGTSGGGGGGGGRRNPLNLPGSAAPHPGNRKASESAAWPPVAERLSPVAGPPARPGAVSPRAPSAAARLPSREGGNAVPRPGSAWARRSGPGNLTAAPGPCPGLIDLIRYLLGWGLKAQTRQGRGESLPARSEEGSACERAALTRDGPGRRLRTERQRPRPRAPAAPQGLASPQQPPARPVPRAVTFRGWAPPAGPARLSSHAVPAQRLLPPRSQAADAPASPPPPPPPALPVAGESPPPVPGAGSPSSRRPAPRPPPPAARSRRPATQPSVPQPAAAASQAPVLSALPAGFLRRGTVTDGSPPGSPRRAGRGGPAWARGGGPSRLWGREGAEGQLPFTVPLGETWGVARDSGLLWRAVRVASEPKGNSCVSHRMCVWGDLRVTGSKGEAPSPGNVSAFAISEPRPRLRHPGRWFPEVSACPPPRAASSGERQLKANQALHMGFVRL